LARARSQIALGKVKEGEASLREALRLQPANYEAWLELAAVYARTRDAGRLFEVLGEINNMMAGRSEAHPGRIMRYRFLLAQGYFLTSRSDEARNILSDMISRHPDFTPAYVALADSYIRDGKPQIAEFVVKRAMDRGKDDAALENLLGAVAFSRKDLRTAAAHFSRAVELSPTYCQALVNRANLAIRENDLSSAEEDLNRALAIDPGNVDALVAKGVVFRRTGRAELARASFERVLEIDPVNPNARFNLAVLNAVDLNRREVALRLFEEVASMGQASPALRSSAESHIADLKSMM
jgi:Flp pilus assembly protein TadD